MSKKFRISTKRTAGKIIADIQDDIDDLKWQRRGRGYGGAPVAGGGGGGAASLTFPCEKILVQPEEMKNWNGDYEDQLSNWGCCIDEQNRLWVIIGETIGDLANLYGFWREKEGGFEKVLEVEMGDETGYPIAMACTRDGHLRVMSELYGAPASYRVYDFGTSEAPAMGDILHSWISILARGLAIDSADKEWVWEENDPGIQLHNVHDDTFLSAFYTDRGETLGITGDDWLVYPSYSSETGLFLQKHTEIQMAAYPANNYYIYSGGFRLSLDDLKLRAIASGSWLYYLDESAANVFVFECGNALKPIT